MEIKIDNAVLVKAGACVAGAIGIFTAGYLVSDPEAKKKHNNALLAQEQEITERIESLKSKKTKAEKEYGTARKNLDALETDYATLREKYNRTKDLMDPDHEKRLQERITDRDSKIEYLESMIKNMSADIKNLRDKRGDDLKEMAYLREENSNLRGDLKDAYKSIKSND